MHERYLEYLRSTGCPWLTLAGSPEDRTRAGLAAVDELLSH